MTDPSLILERLLEGNRRFAAGNCQHAKLDPDRRTEVAGGQAPFATIVTCADSRVPPELLFDTGLGELFTIRVAGNVLTPTQLGSVEFAAYNLNCPLVIVLGHSGCGAVRATIDHGADPSGLPANLRSIVDCIAPLIGGETDLGAAVKANAKAGAEIVRKTLTTDTVVRAAEYDLKSGLVELLDESAGS